MIGELEFEVEYINGEKNREGKEYNNYGKLELEGEYLNGEKWNGKGKEYYNNGKIKFEGEYFKQYSLTPLEIRQFYENIFKRDYFPNFTLLKYFYQK